MSLSVVKENDNYIVIHKPSGIATQTSKLGEKDLVSEVKNYLAKSGSKNPYLAVINRLDQPVEGLVLFAKNEKAAADLSKQLNDNKINKTYYATVWGHMPDSEGVLEDYLLKDGKTNTSKVVNKGVNNSKLAKLEYKVISSDENTDILKIHLLTGRHHQIRVQFANAKHPLLGDTKYGSNESIAYSKSISMRFVWLKAYGLVFTDPKTKEAVNIELDLK